MDIAASPSPVTTLGRTTGPVPLQAQFPSDRRETLMAQAAAALPAARQAIVELGADLAAGAAAVESARRGHALLHDGMDAIVELLSPSKVVAFYGLDQTALAFRDEVLAPLVAGAAAPGPLDPSVADAMRSGIARALSGLDVAEQQLAAQQRFRHD